MAKRLTSVRAVTVEVGVYRPGMDWPHAGDIVERDYGLARVLAVTVDPPTDDPPHVFARDWQPGDFIVRVEYEMIPYEVEPRHALTLTELVARLTALLPEHADKIVRLEGCDCDGDCTGIDPTHVAYRDGRMAPTVLLTRD